MRVSVRAAALALAAWMSASAAQAACEFSQVAELPVTMRGLRPTITTKINGHDAIFVVDTGAFYSMISEDAAKRFGMKPTMAPVGLRIRGVGGGDAPAEVARAQDFVFADTPYKNVEFLIGGRVAGAETVGLLGQNILGSLDVEYDLANGYLRFFRAKGCGADANLAYWSAGVPVSRLPLKGGGNGPVLLKVTTAAKIDGHPITVHWDSGASLSVLSQPAAARAGVRPTSENVTSGGIGYGIFGGGLETSLAPFKSFSIGDETVTNTRLRVSDIELQDADMLLGADFFLSHRILISRSQDKIYFTYNGGPVFRLDREPRPAQAAVAAAPAPKDDAPQTADAFGLRAAASLARRDFPSAIAEFGKAIDLDPAEPRYYRERAMARLGAGQPLGALADLTETLKRKPDDTTALIARGGLYLSVKQEAKARADFDAAQTASPGDYRVALRIGGIYDGHDAFEPALEAYGRALAARPDAAESARILNSRCWLRARWGHELDAALADCDLALKTGGRNSAFMDSRGLVLLRLGRFDEAIRQYDAAIKAQPKHAWSLYGRGLAKLRKGDKAGGDADIAAATAIEPRVADLAKRIGLTPDGPPGAAG